MRVIILLLALMVAAPAYAVEPGEMLADPALEMRELRLDWEARLGSAGWVDREAGVARIPIEEAKRLLLERGLPVREAEETR